MFELRLDFVNTSDDKIRELFYKPRHAKWSIDSDGSIILTEWIRLRHDVQKSVINRWFA